jgi:hypothetical protein
MVVLRVVVLVLLQVVNAVQRLPPNSVDEPFSSID